MLTKENIMTKKEQTAKLVDEALESFDGAGRATPKPFLLTRIHAGMNRATESLWEKAGRFISNPAVALSVICLVLLINVTAVLNRQAMRTPTPSEQVAFSSADEFSYTASTIYDTENMQPNDK